MHYYIKLKIILDWIKQKSNYNIDYQIMNKFNILFVK